MADAQATTHQMEEINYLMTMSTWPTDLLNSLTLTQGSVSSASTNQTTVQEHTIPWDSRPHLALKMLSCTPAGCFEPPVLNSCWGLAVICTLPHPQPRRQRGFTGKPELTQGWLLHRLASKFGDIWKREPVGFADGLGIGADEKGRVKIDSRFGTWRSLGGRSRL